MRLGCCDDELPDQELEIIEEASAMIRNGVLCQWLAAATELHTLELTLTMLSGGPAVLRTRDVLAHRTWPRLRELGLSDLETIENHVVELLLRHKESLRKLALSNIDLATGLGNQLLVA